MGQSRQLLVERGSRAFLDPSGGKGSQRREVVLIESGWGSSGFYPESVLRRDGPRVFSAGTPMYLDHPTPREEAERPERSVLDKVGKLVEDARMDGNKLKSVAEIYPHWVPVIDSIADDVGLSIRAWGPTEFGEREGRQGPIVESIVDRESVDYVTQAGAGGRVGQLIESARGHNDQSLQEARRLLEETYGDKIILPDGGTMDYDLLEEANRVSVLDAWEDDDRLQESEREYDLFLERDVSTAERIALAKKGQAIPIKDSDGNVTGGRFPMANCEDVKAAAMSVGRTDQPDIKSFIKRVASKLSCPVPFKESGSGRQSEEVEVAEKESLADLRSEFREFKESMGKKLTEAEDRATKAEARADRAEEAVRLREAGRVVAAEVDKIEGLPTTAKSRIIESALRGGDVPVMSDGRLDTSLLQERARAAVREEQEYLTNLIGGDGASLLETGGGGNTPAPGAVRGLNESSPAWMGGGSPAGGGKSEDEALEGAFQRLGLSESASKAAAEGR